jgi:hypothetical protein
MRAPDNSLEEVAVQQSLKTMKMAVSAKQYEERLDKEYAAMASKRMSISPTAKVLNEQMLDRSMLEDNSENSTPVTLFEMSKLADTLKSKLAIESQAEKETSDASLKMQQTLFEQLLKYQNTHVEFTITEKYLNLLSEKQRQQLKLFGTETFQKINNVK